MGGPQPRGAKAPVLQFALHTAIHWDRFVAAYAERRAGAWPITVYSNAVPASRARRILSKKRATFFTDKLYGTPTRWFRTVSQHRYKVDLSITRTALRHHEYLPQYCMAKKALRLSGS